MSYIGTYYAIGSGWILTVLNYFLVGWFNGYYDHYYLDSWKVMVALVGIFTIAGNLSLAIFRYRISEKEFFGSLTENFKWVPLFFIYFGGVSFHVSQALLCHMFGVGMTWGATSKEAEDISFFQEIPRVMKRFKRTFAFCFFLAGLMVAMAFVVPFLWRIKELVAVYPLGVTVGCHFLLPIVLNPNLMLFTW